MIERLVKTVIIDNISKPKKSFCEKIYNSE